MITINLLPQEYRKKERTPMVILLPVLGGIATVLSAIAVAAYVHFVWLAEVTNDRQTLDQTMAQKKPLLAYEKNLLAEESEFKKRADTITSIASGRILATRILDEFVDVLVAGDDRGEEGWLVHLKDLSLTPAKAGAASRRRKGRGAAKKGPKPGGELAFKGLALADRDVLAKFNYMHAFLQKSETYRLNYIDITDPKGRMEHFADDLRPRRAWTVDQKATLKDPSDVLAARKKIAEMARKEGK